jgi:CMP-N-acetylneuraminic acid synthetase
MKNNVCIIPARGGSKRIPKKNIMDFCGKAMIGWTIEAALKSDLFDRVIVSTDAQDIADISKAYGADVPFLREDKQDDISPVSEATVSALKQLKSQLGLEYETVVQLMANCPLRDEKDIRTAMDNFAKRDLDFQLSSFKFGWMNPWWSVKISDTGKPISLFPEAKLTRSQDLPKLYCPTGAIWIAKVNKLLASNSFYGEGYEFFEMDWISALDIDDYDDVQMAEAAFLVKNKKPLK